MKLLKIISRLFIVLGLICLSLVFYSWYKSPELTYMQIFRDNIIVYVLAILFLVGGYIGYPDK